MAKGLFELSLVLSKTIPIRFFEPEYIGCEAHTSIALRESLFEFINPTLTNSHWIETSFLEIPLCVGSDFDLPRVQISLEVGHSLTQNSLHFFCNHGLRCHTQAEFTVFQTSFEKRNEKIQQIFFGLVK